MVRSELEDGEAEAESGEVGDEEEGRDHRGLEGPRRGFLRGWYGGRGFRGLGGAAEGLCGGFGNRRGIKQQVSVLDALIAVWESAVLNAGVVAEAWGGCAEV
jgi:hypothetical protein